MSLVGSLHSLGLVASELGYYTHAHRYYDESLAIARELGDKHGLVRVLKDLAQVVYAEGEYQRSRHLFAEGLQLAHELLDRVTMVYLFEGLADIASSEGVESRAIQLLAVASALRRTINAPRTAAEQAKHTLILAHLRRSVDADYFTQVWDEGSDYDLNAAINLAMPSQQEGTGLYAGD